LLPPAPPGLPAGFLDWEELDPAAPPLGEVLELPLAPDEPEVPDADDPALDPPSRSHPATRAPLSANANAAANAVSFILTSFGLCAPDESN
jgi:hypothetical protein